MKYKAFPSVLPTRIQEAVTNDVLAGKGISVSSFIVI
jgi:hypothetical protein